jgi:hypothetical protein
MDDAVAMVRRQIDCVELERVVAGIDDVVLVPAGTMTAKTFFDLGGGAVRIVSPDPSSTRKNWSSLCVSMPISSFRLSDIRTSWQFLAV